MDNKVKVYGICLFSTLSTILWIIGIIKADILFYIIALIITCIILPLAYINRNMLDEFFSKRNGKTIEDERTKLIEAKASNFAYAINTVVMINIIIIILTLRNVYPNLLNIAWILIIVEIISLISFIIGKKYYS
ncbi:MAG: DUF2178 domain-containing protein [archaeon]|nr:DUF2178 domain-containing protein [archaeon]